MVDGDDDGGVDTDGAGAGGTDADGPECDEETYEISQVYRAYLDRVRAAETYTERRAAWTDDGSE